VKRLAFFGAVAKEAAGAMLKARANIEFMEV
jgi:hypothetical protein